MRFDGQLLHGIRTERCDLVIGVSRGLYSSDMSSDQTFLTNEPGKTLRDRFNDLLRTDTRLFDTLVGYFYISGFHALRPSLDQTDKIRILVGIQTDRATHDAVLAARAHVHLDLQSHAQTKEQIPDAILHELQTAHESAAVEQGVLTFIDWLKTGKVEIRAYPSERLHAKLYIMTFHEGDRDKGRVITGSSNFTQAGLQDNLEFNVELKSRADYDFALAKFNELWDVSTDVGDAYVTTVSKQSPYAAFTPYELYLKFLYEYFRGTLNLPDALDDAYLPEGFKQLKYQQDAVLNLSRVLNDYGGAFLSDVVGLGKTYMSALLAQHLNERCLVIAPPHLLDPNNPGSWASVFRDFGVRGFLCESLGKLESLANMDLSPYTTVFIDESHRFRSEDTQSYELLAQICRGRKVVLVSATPLNNAPNDILSQIKLFQPAKNSTIPNERNLEAFFAMLRKRLDGLDRQHDRAQYFSVVRENARLTRERILKYLMVRRTRSEIERYYGDDLRRQGIRFPEVVDPEPLYYTFNALEAKVFEDTIVALTKTLRYARYQPLAYYTGTRNAPTQTTQSQANLATFMKIMIVKRLESSFAAFRLTLGRMILSYERVIDTLQGGKVFLSKKHMAQVLERLECGDDAGVAQLLDTERAEQLLAADFTPQFADDLRHDLATLHELRDRWRLVTRDPKWDAFQHILTHHPRLTHGKLVIFTESTETAEHLTAQVRAHVDPKALLYTGQSSKVVRDAVLQNFDARAFRPQDDYRILVTTDVLAEGVSLHRSNIVINYDIPWNPTRLIQRVGRVNRVDTTFERIHTYNFFPTNEGNDAIKLREAAEVKIHAFIQMLGADARLLTDDEEVVSHDLFARLHSKQTITGEDDADPSELQYLTEIRSIRETQPDLFEKIKRLPKRARSTRLVAPPPPQGSPALLTYWRHGRLDKFFVSADRETATTELDFMSAAMLLKPSDPLEAKQPMPPVFYELLERNRSAFTDATTADITLDAPTHRGNPNDTFILRRLKDNAVRRCQQFMDEDEQFVERVIRLIEDGALPRVTARTVAAALRAPENLPPLKVLGVLRRAIRQELFEINPAIRAGAVVAPREVILSSLLITPR